MSSFHSEAGTAALGSNRFEIHTSGTRVWNSKTLKEKLCVCRVLLMLSRWEKLSILQQVGVRWNGTNSSIQTTFLSSIWLYVSIWTLRYCVPVADTHNFPCFHSALLYRNKYKHRGNDRHVLYWHTNHIYEWIFNLHFTCLFIPPYSILLSICILK